MKPELRRRAGHYEVLGETYAKFEFFQDGWNPYSRFLDVDKVDLILRKATATGPLYREVQVKFGKLYEVGSLWERRLFDLTSWRFFKEGEFDGLYANLYVAYVLSPDDGYHGDLFIFPVREFADLLLKAPLVEGKRRSPHVPLAAADKASPTMRCLHERGCKPERDDPDAYPLRSGCSRSAEEAADRREARVRGEVHPLGEGSRPAGSPQSCVPARLGRGRRGRDRRG